MHIHVTSIFALAAFALLAPVAAQAQDRQLKPVADDRRVGFDAIDPEICREWLTYLSSDELGGRATGTPGYKKAAEYIAARFKEFGLKPVGDGGTYFQAVPFSSVGPSKDSHIAVVGGDGKEIFRIKPGAGLGGQISEKSERELGIVHLVANNADDVAAAGDLTGKAVIMIDRSPRARRGTEASLALRRAQAGAVITISDAAAQNVNRRVSSGGGRNRVRSSRFRRPNSYAVSTEVAARLKDIVERDAGAKLSVHVDIAQEPVFGANVVGFLEGSDPDLKKEIVGIGSHLDHIGTRGDQINNGADDDGSGTTGVLAVARAFALNGVKPRRSILFMCFAGEEMGLIGSRYYTNNPIFPNESMVAELQMDMIGRNEEVVNRRTGEVTEKPEDNLNSLHLVGTKKLSMALHKTCLAINEAHVGFDFEYDEEDVFGRSDHANFARKDIPIAFFFTGFHPQYHRPDDTVEKIDFPKLARVAKLVYGVAMEIAQADQRPKRDRTWAEIPNQRRRR